MVFAVSVKYGDGKVTMRFPTAGQAVSEATSLVEHGQTDVSVRVSATGKVYTLDKFAEKLMIDAYPEAGP